MGDPELSKWHSFLTLEATATHTPAMAHTAHPSRRSRRSARPRRRPSRMQRTRQRSSTRRSANLQLSSDPPHSHTATDTQAMVDTAPTAHTAAATATVDTVVVASEVTAMAASTRSSLLEVVCTSPKIVEIRGERGDMYIGNHEMCTSKIQE